MFKAGSHQALKESRRTEGESVGRAARVIILSLIFFSSAFAADEAEYPAGAPAIPPGQEELIASMLGQGATLPDGCALSSGTAAYNTITARYSCKAGEVEFTLAHPLLAGEHDAITEDFAISQHSGAPADKLKEALVALVRSREANFEWIWPAKDDAPDDQDAEANEGDS